MKRRIELSRMKELLPGLAELGPGPRAGVLPIEKIDAGLADLLGDADLTGTSPELIRGLILLWHDHFDPAHEIAQGIETPDGSYLHGILHRREPDYGNAAYWFRRAGRHPCFSELGRRVTALLEARKETELTAALISRGEWDPLGFVARCEKQDRGHTAKTQILRETQKIESEVLLEHWASSGA